ncbi:MAG: helix-turn-helix domain-containing protein [Haloarculaceae archaeon]
MTDEANPESGSDPFDFPDGDDERTDVDLGNRDYAVYRCRDCENVVLAVRDSDGSMTCHDRPMERVTETKLDVRTPDIRQVLLDAFGLPKPGLDICLCVIGEGPLPPAELADRLDYDESTVRNYLNELVEFGLLEKSQLNRESGGFVNVYHSIDLEEMREETLVGFYAWAGEAASLIEEANLTKEDYREADYEEGLTEVFWERFREANSPG